MGKDRRAPSLRRLEGLAAAVVPYLLALLALAVAAALVLANFALKLAAKNPIWSNMVADLASNLVTFVVLYVLFIRRGIEVPARAPSADVEVELFQRHDDVDWRAAIDGARTLDIVVHYYNRWAREHFDALVRFFERGGSLRLIMADPGNWGVLSPLHDHFFANLSIGDLRARIGQTELVLREAHAAASSSKARLDIHYVPQILHYALVRANKRDLYLSVYEQFRGKVIRSPVFRLDLRRDSEAEAYWDETIDSFIAAARPA